MELAPIAEAQPVLARFRVQSYETFRTFLAILRENLQDLTLKNGGTGMK